MGEAAVEILHTLTDKDAFHPRSAYALVKTRAS